MEPMGTSVSEQDVVLERLKLLNEYVNDLLELQDVDLQTYTENKLIHRTVERTLHLAVEACLDIGQHIIAQERFRTPEDNKDVADGYIGVCGVGLSC